MLDEFGGGRPNDQRNLFGINIGSVLGGVGGFLVGGPAGAAAGAKLGGGLLGGKSKHPSIPGTFSQPTFGNIPGRVPNISTGIFGPQSPIGQSLTKSFTACPPGFSNVNGRCEENRPGVTGAIQRFLPGGSSGTVPFGSAEMGQFGAGLQPAVSTTTTRNCPRGAVLGMDGLCYNRRDIRNADRAWPRGRRPLLTGGEMRCISVAARAANKIKTKTKQLQSMGMLAKPTRRAPARRQLARPSIVNIDND